MSSKQRQASQLHRPTELSTAEREHLSKIAWLDDNDFAIWFILVCVVFATFQSTRVLIAIDFYFLSFDFFFVSFRIDKCTLQWSGTCHSMECGWQAAIWRDSQNRKHNENICTTACAPWSDGARWRERGREEYCFETDTRRSKMVKYIGSFIKWCPEKRTKTFHHFSEVMRYDRKQARKPSTSPSDKSINTISFTLNNFYLRVSSSHSELRAHWILLLLLFIFPSHHVSVQCFPSCGGIFSASCLFSARPCYFYHARNNRAHHRSGRPKALPTYVDIDKLIPLYFFW